MPQDQSDCSARPQRLPLPGGAFDAGPGRLDVEQRRFVLGVAFQGLAIGRHGLGKAALMRLGDTAIEPGADVLGIVTNRLVEIELGLARLVGLQELNESRKAENGSGLSSRRSDKGVPV